MKHARQPKIKSKYKINEEFDFRNTPKKFESVTENSIRDLKAYCFDRAKSTLEGDFAPGALKATLNAIVGSFNFALAQLEGDYSARRNMLENAKVSGLADVHAQVYDFERLVQDHNSAYDAYSAAYFKIYGEKPETNLKVSQSKVDAIVKAYESLE